MSNKLFEYTGTVHHIGPTQKFASGFTKRVLVCVNYGNSKYPDYAVFDFIKDRTAKLDEVIVGEQVKVRFFLSGNESKSNPGQWFSSAQGLSCEHCEEADGGQDGGEDRPSRRGPHPERRQAAQCPTQAASRPLPPPAEPPASVDGADEELPF